MNFPTMYRYWLLTSTTYGNWLPGDPRGFVSAIHEPDGSKVIHNTVGTEYDRDIPGLQEFGAGQLNGPPNILNLAHAEAMCRQFHQTANHCGYQIRAIAIMATHVHLVVGVPGDPDPAVVLGVFKSYASRVLNRKFGRPKSDTWWTERGSKRKLKDNAALLAAIEYVRNQARPLIIWIAGEDPPPSDEQT